MTNMTPCQRSLRPVLAGLFVCLAASCVIVSPGVAQAPDESFDEREEFGGSSDGVAGYDRTTHRFTAERSEAKSSDEERIINGKDPPWTDRHRDVRSISPEAQSTEGWKPAVPIASERSNNGPIGDRRLPNQPTTEKSDA